MEKIKEFLRRIARDALAGGTAFVTGVVVGFIIAILILTC